MTRLRTADRESSDIAAPRKTASPAQRVRSALADTRGAAARGRGFGIIRPHARDIVLEFPVLAPALRTLKLEALAANQELVRLAVDRMQANGIHVFLARTNQEAVDY